MAEILETQYVNQRQYGIIAPYKDSNQVKKLVTAGMYSCFGVAVFDKESNVGMFTHLDYVEDLGRMVDDSMPVLEALGVNRLAVTTINIDSLNLQSYNRQTVFSQRKRDLDRLVETLIGRNIFEGTEWTDHGVSKEAIFEPRMGIIPATFEQLGLIREQLDEAFSYTGRLAEVAKRNSGSTRALAISCAYMPAGIEIGTSQTSVFPEMSPDPQFRNKPRLFDWSQKPVLSEEEIDRIFSLIKLSKDKYP